MAGDGGESAGGERLHFASASSTDDLAETGVERDRPQERPLPPRTAPIGDRDPARKKRPPLRFSAVAAGIAAAIARDMATEWERGTAFLFIPVFLAAGVVLYFSLDFEPASLPIFTSGIALSGMIARARGRFRLRVALASMLLVIAGFGLAKLETWRLSTKMMGSAINSHITGRVVEIEKLASGRTRLTIDIIATSRPHLRYVPERIRISARKVPPGIVVGGGVSGYARLLPPTGPVRPSGYDFSFQSYFMGIGASGFFLSTPEPAAIGPPPPDARIGQALESIRTALSNHIRARIGGADGEIAVALVTGMQAGIPESINESLRVTGVAHVLSISGLHMALVAGIVMIVIRLLLAAFPDFSSRHAAKKYAAATALAAITFYLLISGNGVATQRSFFMLAIMLLAVLFDRTAISMRNFAIAAILVIATAPHEVTGPSFQMSFAATAALVAAYAAWSEAKQQRHAGRKIPPTNRSRFARGTGYVLSHVGGVAMTSLVAGSATALFAAWHFQRISSLGVVGNLVTMPVISFVVMPAMVAAMIAMPFGLDGPFFSIMGWGIGVFTRIAMALSHYSPFNAIGLIPAGTVILMTLGLVALTLATTRLRLAGLPLLVVGLLFLPFRAGPDVFVSENGKLVGLRLSDGRLAVNSNRPSAFDVENWSHAMMTNAVVKPGKDRPSAMPTIAPEVPFSCTHSLCIAWNAAGAVVAYAVDAAAAVGACPIADLIIIDDATAHDPCEPDGPAVITKRDLARYGAAAVTFTPVKGGPIRTSVRYAVSKPYRPWHAERTYLRAARGLPPYRRKKRKSRKPEKKGPEKKSPEKNGPGKIDTVSSAAPVRPAVPAP
jgi:competence protein ComEC